MLSGIVIDNWKLPIFERRLTQAGYSFTKHKFTDDSMTLKVEFSDLAALKSTVEAANAEAALTGAPK